MPYHNVDPDTAKGLVELRKRITAANIPTSKLDQNIVVASWNIREFGRKPRTKKAIHLIAEILSYFDLTAIQELRGNLEDLGKVMAVLGPDWRVIFSDVTEGTQGNQERIAYLYDRRAVAFTGLAAEAVVPPVVTKQNGKKVTTPGEQFWRTPYMASFSAGGFDFVLITVHVQWNNVKDRTAELGRIADWVEARRKSKFAEDKDIILLGDFNIPKMNDALYKAITQHGLTAPKALFNIPGSNLQRTARYDQILYYPHLDSVFTNVGGVLDFYGGNHKPLFPDLDATKFTYQLSDHLPLWIQVDTDTADQELDQIIKQNN